ncbi:hypothetical protein B0H17DRAFT_1217176 [Mycena rosella]|uniref:Retrotransposon gag domain-containing protein n=1 Tax=Mycena rosella TaxID=1033263 RepID=A0AAD7FPE2_MYCRO|nr:hypothetical protein B0H17DRAFT_1217176 [Mycena rosella]
MSTQRSTGYHNRARTHDGHASPPPPVYGPSPASPSPEAHSSPRPASLDSPSEIAGPPVAGPEHGISGADPEHEVFASGNSPSTEFPLTESPSFNDEQGAASGPDEGPDNGGWTPVTYRTARTHRQNSNSLSHSNKFTNTPNSPIAANIGDVESESTIARATREMSSEELVDIAERYEALAAAARVDLACKKLVQADKSGETTGETIGNEPITNPIISVETNTTSRGDVYTREEDGRSYDHQVKSPTGNGALAGAGPSQSKGKGPDPRNWGNISSWAEWSDDEMEAQKEAIENYEEINCALKKERQSTPPGFFKDIPSSKSPEPIQPQKVNFSKVESEKPENAPASDHSTQKGDGNMSGQTQSECAEMRQQLEELKQMLKASKKPAAPSERQKALKVVNELTNDKTKHCATPRRLVVQSFIAKAICGVSKAASDPPTPDPSDSSSGSDSEKSDADSSSEESEGGKSSAAAHHRRITTAYDGSPNATAFHRMAREAKAYVDQGNIPKDEQVFYVLYFLKASAAEFYNQVVVPNEEEYDLVKFFTELFEFCFPVDYRTHQRKALDRCYQGSRTVAAHVAIFSEIFNTIGMVETQEKIIKLWNSFGAEIQQEMYRQKLDPEVSTWTEVVQGASDAEIVVNLAHKPAAAPSGQPRTGGNSSHHGGSSSSNTYPKPQRGGFRGCGRDAAGATTGHPVAKLCAQLRLNYQPGLRWRRKYLRSVARSCLQRDSASNVKKRAI